MASYKDTIAKLKKAWDCPDMMDAVKRDIAKIPFSSPLLNYATYGGVPRNAITEFHGAPGGGKSTSALDICHNASELFKKEFEEEVQSLRDKISSGKKEYAGPLEDLLDRGPKKVLYVDLEHTFDWKWAKKMHIEEGDIDVMQPPNIAAEDILQAFQEIVETGEIGLAVLDSIPTLVCRAELEKKYGERTVASLAGLLTVFTRKIVPVLTRHECTLICINQIRDNMDNPYVVNTPGGQALKFYCTLRMLFRLGSGVDFVGNELPASSENPAGYIVNVKIVKQKGAAFDRKLASYYLMAQSGIRPDFDFAKLAINKYNVIGKAGAWFSFIDPTTGEILEEDGKPVKVNGMPKVYDYLEAHPAYYAKLKEYILADIEGRDPSYEEDIESSSTEDSVEYALSGEGEDSYGESN